MFTYECISIKYFKNQISHPFAILLRAVLFENKTLIQNNFFAHLSFLQYTATSKVIRLKYSTQWQANNC